MRFTAKGKRLLAIVRGTAAGRLTLTGAGLGPIAGVRRLDGAPLAWSASDEELHVDLPALPDSPAHAFEVPR